MSDIGVKSRRTSIVAFGLFQHYRLTEIGSGWMRALVGEAWHHQLTFSRFALTDYLLR